MILASGLFEPLASHPAEASLILPTDAMKLTDLDFTTVRMLSIDGTTVTAVLEQTAFKLALTCAHKPAHLDQLNRINLIICRARNTAVRERHATVQETKCALRARELALKEAHLNRNLNLPKNNAGGTSSTSPTSKSRDDLSTLHAAPADQKTTQDSAPSTQDSASSEPLSTLNPQLSTPENPSASSASSALIPIPSNSENLPLTTNNLPPLDPADDPIAHLEALHNGTIKPSWIPAEIPCDEEETFLDVFFRNRNKRLQAAAPAAPPNTLNPGNGP